MSKSFSGFYKLSLKDRTDVLKNFSNLTDSEISLLQNSGSLSLEAADKTVENVIGAIHLPLGLATNFVINGKDFIVPMAIEEPSVIAAASKAAKQSSGFEASSDDSIMLGQIQLCNIDSSKIKTSFKKHKSEFMKAANDFLAPKAKYGCSAKNVEIKILKTPRGDMAILYFQISVGNAQGANMVNSTLEAISPIVQKHLGGKLRLRILSNLAIYRKARAKTLWKRDVIGDEIIEGVLDAYEFAQADIFRAATHNKGILNGIDAVVLATGNDWRSSEAGAHAYAAMKGYHSLTHYEKNSAGDLVGSIELPLAIASLGPAINSSPTAKICLKILNVSSSAELAAVVACVGLANNFAALSALSTEGIQKGHMKLHARNIAVYVGAHGQEIDKIAEVLSSEKDFSSQRAKAILSELRK